MIIQLEDGRKIEVQDGSTPEQIDSVVAHLTKNAQPTDEPAGFKPDLKSLIPEDVPLPYGMDKSVIANRNKQIGAHNAYESSFIGDPERQKLKAEEAERGFWSGVGKGMEHIGKEFYAGTLQSPDFLPESVQKILDYRIGGDNDKSRSEVENEINDYMSKENERYEITRGENPLSTTVGETIPFLATGALGERALLSVGNRLVPVTKKASIGLNRALGNVVEANRILNAPKKVKSELVNMQNAVLRGSATGAAEGAAQHDSDALSGATSAAAGGALSHLGILAPLKKVRNERDAAGKKLIDEMYEEGFQITPGVRSGNRALQTEEAGLRNSDVFSQDYYNVIDRPNQRRITDMAGEAIGLPLKDRDMVSQQELVDHMSNLKNQYQELEANTVGKFSLDSFSNINKVLKNAQPVKNRNQSAAARQRYAVLQDAVNEMRTVLQPFTDGNGKFAKQVFDGSKYQDASLYLNDQISKAFRDGDQTLARSLKSIKTELDKSIENGLGKTGSKQWRDLNERYAMTQMLLKNGMTPSGMVDPNKITSAVMNGDEAVRTLTGKGGRIKRFQDIARYNDVLRNVEGGSLTGLGEGNQIPAQRSKLGRAMDYLPSPIQAMRLGYKTNTLTTPFIGRHLSPVHGLSSEAVTNIGRSVAQTETPQDMVLSGYDNLKEILGL